MLEEVLAIPDHVRDALWRVETAKVPPVDSQGVLVCGMGGSAIGGDLAAGALGDRLTRPLLTVRGYRLPSWADKSWTVLGSSYSGETEETLSCFEAAAGLGARRVAATTGGSLAEAARDADVPVIGLPGILPAPRTAVAYMLVCAAEVAALSGVAPRIRDELEAAAASLDGGADRLRSAAEEVVGQIGSALPVVHGADLTVPAARRWKTQLNENAKIPAQWSELPEANHNEICGWEGAGATQAAIFLEDRDQTRRERRRIEVTAEAVVAAGAPAIRLETQGATRAERLLWAVMLGDLVSLRVAEERGVDPLPVTAIDDLKAALDRA
jgi:glucose/mannose-6-phosphate isomerase